jgi:hypothetical protein
VSSSPKLSLRADLPGKPKRLRDLVVALRKQNLSVPDISRALAHQGESLNPAATKPLTKSRGDHAHDAVQLAVQTTANSGGIQQDFDPAVNAAVRNPVLPAVAGDCRDLLDDLFRHSALREKGNRRSASTGS